MSPARSCSALLLLASVACSSAPPPAGFPAEPLVTLASQTQRLTVAVRTSPQPLTRGNQSVEYTIADPTTHAPVSGLALGVVPWMPVMGHGTSVVPSVAEAVPGTYVITNVDLFMPGQWVLRTTISWPPGEAGADAGVASDYVSPTFQIP